MNCLCTLGKHLNEDFWRVLTESRLQRWPVQVLWGGKAASLQMDCYWASKVEQPIPIFPWTYVLLVQSLTHFLPFLVSNQFTLELFFTILCQVWHWHPHRSTWDFRLERSHLWPQALVLLSHWHSQGLVFDENNVLSTKSRLPSYCRLGLQDLITVKSAEGGKQVRQHILNKPSFCASVLSWSYTLLFHLSMASSRTEAKPILISEGWGDHLVLGHLPKNQKAWLAS